jgi:CheY-like chemotaxis protein
LGYFYGAALETPTASTPSQLPIEDQISPKNIRILLAEDNLANVATVSSYLSAKGFTVLVANDGQAAIDQALTEQPDLILMDVQMPIVNGLDAIRTLRQAKECASTPIIALTALAMDGDREACLATGADDYLSKPVKLKQLLGKIEQIISPSVEA